MRYGCLSEVHMQEQLQLEVSAACSALHQDVVGHWTGAKSWVVDGAE